MSNKPPYANESTKRIALTISGVVSIAETLCEMGSFRGSEEAIPILERIHEDAQKALDAVMDGLDAEQAYGILRYGKQCEFTLIPKTSPLCQRGFFIVEPEDVKVIMQDVLSACNFCELKGKEAKKCRMRKMLLRTGIIELDEKDRLDGACPYQSFSSEC